MGNDFRSKFFIKLREGGVGASWCFCWPVLHLVDRFTVGLSLALVRACLVIEIRPFLGLSLIRACLVIEIHLFLGLSLALVSLFSHRDSPISGSFSNQCLFNHTDSPISRLSLALVKGLFSHRDSYISWSFSNSSRARLVVDTLW